MKKLIVIGAFALVVALAASSALGRGELRVQLTPTYDQQRYQQQRDQQWQQSQDNQRRAQQQRDDWQRIRWQRDQQLRNQRHQRGMTYELWLRDHRYDYDNRRSG
jgi:hypothetical protein